MAYDLEPFSALSVEPLNRTVGVAVGLVPVPAFSALSVEPLNRTCYRFRSDHGAYAFQCSLC